VQDFEKKKAEPKTPRRGKAASVGQPQKGSRHLDFVRHHSITNIIDVHIDPGRPTG
jgi:hypothetical protein